MEWGRVRYVDENDLSHHFLEEVALYSEQLGSQGAGGRVSVPHNLTQHREDIT